VVLLPKGRGEGEKRTNRSQRPQLLGETKHDFGRLGGRREDSIPEKTAPTEMNQGKDGGGENEKFYLTTGVTVEGGKKIDYLRIF